jgi:TonB family protein
MDMHTKTRKEATPVVIAAWLLFSCLSMACFNLEANAQQPPAAAASASERERGVKLYKQGDVKGAVKALREAVKKGKDDAAAWYYLSLALNSDDDLKGARKAAERAVKLRPDSASMRAGLAYLLLLSKKTGDALPEAERALALDAQNAEANYVVSVVRFRKGELAKALDAIQAALKAKPDFPAALLWKSQVVLGLYAKNTGFVVKESSEARHQRIREQSALLKDAAESLEKFFQLNPSPPEAELWREQLATIRAYAQIGERDDSNAERYAYLTDELTTKVSILGRPEPQYTDEAREHQVEGTVVLHAIFAVDGTVQHILVLRSLPYGLTERAIKAARQIKFVPATKDGRPVSQFIQIEYNFNLY